MVHISIGLAAANRALGRSALCLVPPMAAHYEGGPSAVADRLTA
jgi:hypothetical protein